MGVSYQDEGFKRKSEKGVMGSPRDEDGWSLLERSDKKPNDQEELYREGELNPQLHAAQMGIIDLPILCMSLILTSLDSTSKGRLRMTSKDLMHVIESHATGVRRIKKRANSKKKESQLQLQPEEKIDALPLDLFSRCSQLKVLDLRWMKIASLHLPGSFPLNLTKITCRGVRPSRYERASFDLSPLSDLSALSLCTNLEEIDVSFSRVSDLSPLADCTRLTKILLRNTTVIDLFPLSSLAGIQKIDISGCSRLDSIDPISCLTCLKSLSADYLFLSSIEPLSQCTNLQKISLYSSQVSSISPLKQCQRLEAVDLGQSHVADLSPLLSSVATLVKLRIDGMRNLEDVGVIAKFKMLKLLDISCAEVEEIGEDDDEGQEGEGEEEDEQADVRQNEIQLLISEMKSLTHLSMSGEASEAMIQALNLKTVEGAEVFEEAYAASDVEED